MQPTPSTATSWLDRAIRATFIVFVFLLPLALTPYNYELFEFNKMLLTYSAATIIGTLWLVKMILVQRIEIKRTILDIPLVLFFVSQVVSTIISIDPHMSIWGYYGRFNGGLVSIICYLLLYYAAVSNLTAANIRMLMGSLLASAFFVSVYGILQRAGIDKELWVQDVQSRVFSTLGQPNWLAAYIAAILPITMALAVISNFKSKIINFKWCILYVLCSMFYAVLLFTGSRSGFLAFWLVNGLFWLVAIALIRPNRKRIVTNAIAINLLFIGLSAGFGTPYPQINQPINAMFTHQSTFNKPAVPPQATASASLANIPAPTVQFSENIVTDSWDIRKTVWPAAIAAWREKPLTGWGTETFAWVFYKFKPIAHNSTSEWDFLYNKAHNEYLNYLATTGAFGLGSYLLVMVVFAVWTMWHIIKSKIPNLLVIGLLFGWLSLLVTNFFGFSVVAIAVLFWLIPACIMVLIQDGQSTKTTYTISMQGTPWINNTSLIFMVGIGMYGLVTISTIWLADYNYAKGVAASDAGRYGEAYNTLSVAAGLRSNVPLYHSELATTLSSLALSSFADNDATQSGHFAQQAIDESNTAIRISPQNLNSWKSRTRMYYALSQLDETYINDTLKSIAIAESLAPTDAKIAYNLGLIYHAIGDTEEAIKTLEQTMVLKPNYRDAAYALALFYEEDKKPDKARIWFQYILEKINPNDEEVKKNVK